MSSSSTSLLRTCTRLRALAAITPLRSFSTAPALRESSEKATKPVTANYTRPPAPKSRATGTPLPVLPLIVIFIVGTASFYHLAKSRDGQGTSHYVLPPRETKRDDIYHSKRNS